MRHVHALQRWSPSLHPLNLRGTRAVCIEEERKGSIEEPLNFVVERFLCFCFFSPDLWKDLLISGWWGGGGVGEREPCDFTKAKIMLQTEQQAAICHRSGLCEEQVEYTVVPTMSWALITFDTGLDLHSTLDSAK